MLEGAPAYYLASLAGWPRPAGHPSRNPADHRDWEPSSEEDDAVDIEDRSNGLETLQGKRWIGWTANSFCLWLVLFFTCWLYHTVRGASARSFSQLGYRFFIRYHRCFWTYLSSRLTLFPCKKKEQLKNGCFRLWNGNLGKPGGFGESRVDLPSRNNRWLRMWHVYINSCMVWSSNKISNA